MGLSESVLLVVSFQFWFYSNFISNKKKLNWETASDWKINVTINIFSKCFFFSPERTREYSFLSTVSEMWCSHHPCLMPMLEFLDKKEIPLFWKLWHLTVMRKNLATWTSKAKKKNARPYFFFFSIIGSLNFQQSQDLW